MRARAFPIRCSGNVSVRFDPWLVALLAALAAACGDDDGDAPREGEPAGSVSYARDIAPIFRAKCVHCHHSGSAIGVNLMAPFDPEEGVIGRPRTRASGGSEQALIVDPGNAADSFLVVKVSETDLDESVDGSPMPLAIPRVTEDELSAIRRWIDDGANDDAFFAENVAPIFGTAITLDQRAGKCTFCHYPGTLNPPNVLDVFDPETGMVDVLASFGGIIVVPGDAEDSLLVEKLSDVDPPGNPMPWVPERLTATEVAKVEAWIQDGAQNN